MRFFFIFLLTFSISLPLGCESNKSIIGKTNYTFVRDYHFENGVIKRSVLESYLSRAVTMAEFCTGVPFYIDGSYSYKQDDIRMLENIGAKLIGRCTYLWGHESYAADPSFWHDAKQMINKMHGYDGQIIFQAGIFEIITTQVNKVKIPVWVFEEFNLPVEDRNFRYDSMLNKKGILVDHWSPGASVPDIARLETRMWFYYLAKKYIDIGIEAIHFGQVELMSMGNKNLAYSDWMDILSRIRKYAQRHARRKMILCDAHLPSGGIPVKGKLLFDFHSYPSRPKALVGKPQKAVLKKGFLDSFYGRSKGGITPSGWTCKHLPYLVELDNFGISDHPGKFQPSDYYVWGYDEISWFSLQPKDYRDQWLISAWKWIRKTDPNGFLEMPGSRVITTGASYHRGYRYRANTKSTSCPLGYGQKITIKNIWMNDK